MYLSSVTSWKNKRIKHIWKVKSSLENLQLDSCKPINVCTEHGNDRQSNWHVNFAWQLFRSLSYEIAMHCKADQEPLCEKSLHLQHVILPVVKCLNKISTGGLNKRIQGIQWIVRFGWWCFHSVMWAGFLEIKFSVDCGNWKTMFIIFWKRRMSCKRNEPFYVVTIRC